MTDQKKDIFILDCVEIQCPLVLKYVFRELCQAFQDRDFTVKEISRIEDIHDNSIVFMGNTFNTKNPAELLNQVAPNAIYIGWYWHDEDVSTLKNFMYTYENMLNPPEWRQSKFDIMRKGDNHCPLLLRASDDPQKISHYERRVTRDYCYMGWRYKSDWVPSEKFTGIYHGTYDHNHFLDYNTRRNIYLSSTFALGFQSDENIRDQHVSQRIFEGLAYGCIVFSESPEACKQTNDIVVFIESKADLENKMEYYTQNVDKLLEKQQQGYEFVKKCGTNHYAISKFLDVINNVLKLSL